MPPASESHVLPALPESFTASIEAVLDRGPALETLVVDLVPTRFTSLFLVGCGGSLFTFAPIRNLLDRSPVPVFTYNSSELMLRRPALLGPHALVIVSSTHGATKETAEAAKAAAAAGATVLGVTQDPESVVGAACQHLLLHQGVEAKQVVLMQLGWALLKGFGVVQDDEYTAALSALRQSPQAFASAHTEWDGRLSQLAEELYKEPFIYVLGSGPLEGAAQTLAMCYLQEMQKLNTAAIGTGEFLHGPFEVVTDEVPVIVLKDTEATRPMAERVEAFLRQHTGRLWVLDAAELALPGVTGGDRSQVADLVLGSTVLNRIAEQFSARTRIPLTDRRYMWKIEY